MVMLTVEQPALFSWIAPTEVWIVAAPTPPQPIDPDRVKQLLCAVILLAMQDAAGRARMAGDNTPGARARIMRDAQYWLVEEGPFWFEAVGMDVDEDTIVRWIEGGCHVRNKTDTASAGELAGNVQKWQN